MSERLTALDATFLELEEADESAHMHTGVIMVRGGEVTADVQPAVTARSRSPRLAAATSLIDQPRR